MDAWPECYYSTRAPGSSTTPIDDQLDASTYKTPLQIPWSAPPLPEPTRPEPPPPPTPRRKTRAYSTSAGPNPVRFHNLPCPKYNRNFANLHLLNEHAVRDHQQSSRSLLRNTKSCSDQIDAKKEEPLLCIFCMHTYANMKCLIRHQKEFCKAIKHAFVAKSLDADPPSSLEPGCSGAFPKTQTRDPPDNLTCENCRKTYRKWEDPRKHRKYYCIRMVTPAVSGEGESVLLGKV